MKRQEAISMKPIPISSAKKIAEAYGYSQVIIIARAVGDGGGEHVTTYGINRENCDVAARIGDFLKYKVMGWKAEGSGEAAKK
jgi:hypothetical protein